MKKIKRLLVFSMAIIMLLSLFAACSPDYSAENGEGSTELESESNHGSEISNDSSNDSSNDTSNDTSSKEDKYGLSGDVWEAMKQRGCIYLDADSIKKAQLNNSPLPLTFLAQEGAVSGSKVNGTTASLGDRPLQARAFTDESTEANDIYLIVNHTSGWLAEQYNEDIIITTWTLKYTLADDDYQTFLNLSNDFRIKYFVQEMDKIYQPELVGKSIAMQKKVAAGAPYQSVFDRKSAHFPNIHISNIDYDNMVVTYGVIKDGVIKFYDVEMMNETYIQEAVDTYGMSRDEVVKYIKLVTKESTFGTCFVNCSVLSCGPFYKERLRNIYKENAVTPDWKEVSINNYIDQLELTK